MRNPRELTAPPAAPPTPAAIPAAWRSPLPHGGSTAALAQWWQRFDDPLLARLIARAEAQSPTLEQAAARRRQAEAGATQARACLMPQVGMGAQVQRGRALNGVAGDSTQASAQFSASWEIDLFGGQRAAAWAAALHVVNAHGNNAIGVAVGPGIEKDVVNYAEDRGGGSDAQRQSQNCEHGESGLSPETPERIAHVMPKCIHAV